MVKQTETEKWAKGQNQANVIKGWVTIYVIIGVLINGFILTPGHWILGTFLSPAWPIMLIGKAFSISGWGG